MNTYACLLKLVKPEGDKEDGISLGHRVHFDSEL